MVSTPLSRSISQPVAGLTILALIAVACPSPTRLSCQTQMGWLQHQQEPHSLCKRSRRIRTSSLQHQQEPHSLCKRSRRIQTSSLQHQQNHTACASADRLLIREAVASASMYLKYPNTVVTTNFRLVETYLPLIGRVGVAGQTQEQAAETVTLNMLAS